MKFICIIGLVSLFIGESPRSKREASDLSHTISRAPSVLYVDSLLTSEVMVS